MTVADGKLRWTKSPRFWFALGAHRSNWSSLTSRDQSRIGLQLRLAQKDNSDEIAAPTAVSGPIYTYDFIVQVTMLIRCNIPSQEGLLANTARLSVSISQDILPRYPTYLPEPFPQRSPRFFG